MPAAPVLMVLYSNDAVEVRYSDGSCIQVAPCGSTFIHHESPGEAIHPAHGMKVIHQRSQFSTSNYRDKVIQAIDFRNRFSERPYVCQELLPEDQLVPLYARIQEVAWTKGIDGAKYEFLPDGGVRLISEDEFASLVLSPHRSDFTVCFLCRISKESSKQKKSYRIKKQINKNVVESARQKPLQDNKVDQKDKYNNDNGKRSSRECDIEGKSDHSSPGSQERQRGLQDDLSISPISIASSQRSEHSSPADDKEGHGHFHRYSTPTLAERSPEILGNGQKQKNKDGYRKENEDSLDGSYLEIEKHNSSIGKNSNASMDNCDSRNSQEKSSTETIVKSSDNSVNDSHDKLCNMSKHLSGHSCSDESGSVVSFDSDNSDISTRSLYSWVTKHFSCDECPVAWSHPVNIARALLDNKTAYEKKALKTSVHSSKHNSGTLLQKIRRETCNLSKLPQPLPLTCPGQHLHKQQSKFVYDDGQSPVDNMAIIKQGRLKVLMVEGVVYRIVRLSSTKIIEIFPGDGSVFVSEGLSGHFFRHLIPQPQLNSVEERTYTLKALPPTPPTAAYSIEKLLKRANRFLVQVNQEDKILTNDLCCWKHEENKVMEPLPTSLLEECTVKGFGRFTAFSNGHVRVVFEDRTSLDMMCDFTKRIDACIEHSHNSEQVKQRCHIGEQHKHQHLMSKYDHQAKQGLCKLLLPSGQYQMVDINQPGIYRKYTDAALEWADWVNSSPNERKIFYKAREMEPTHEMMAAKELQKIKCFNYIIDSTSQVQDNRVPPTGNPEELSHFKGDNSPESFAAGYSADQPFQRTNSLCNHGNRHFEGQSSWMSESSRPSSHFVHSNRSVQSESCIRGQLNGSRSTSAYSSLSLTTSQPHHGHISNHGNVPGRFDSLSGKNMSLEMLRGFHSVREALLKTSQVINDIDDILTKK